MDELKSLDELEKTEEFPFILDEGKKVEEKVEEKAEEEEVGEEEELLLEEEEEEEEKEKEKEKGTAPVDLEALRQRWVAALEAKYSIPEELGEALATEPQKVLPKLLARVHAEAAQSVYEGLTATLPSLIEQAIKQVDEKKILTQQVKKRVSGVPEKEVRGVVEKLVRAGFSRKEAVEMASAALAKKGGKAPPKQPVPREVRKTAAKPKSIWADRSFWE